METKTDVLILGGGPAGIQGSRMLKIKRPDWDVTMIRRESASMVYCAIPYALEGLFGPEKVYKKDELVTEVGVKLMKETAVEANLKEKWVKTAEGNTVHFDKMLFVPGSINFVPPVPGHTLDGVLTVKTNDDMMAILNRLDNGAENAVVIGAGAIGIEQAIAFRTRGVNTHLVDMAKRILPNLSDADMSDPLRDILLSTGMHLHLGAALKEFTGQDGKVSGVVLDTGEVLSLNPGKDFVVVAVGMRPVIDLVKDQLEIGRTGIIVNRRMETSVPDVYSAGDVVQMWSAIDNKDLDGKLATNAVPMAKVAAVNIMGGHAEYPGIVNGAVTVIGDLRIGGTGFTEEFAGTRGFEVVTGFGETTSRFSMMPGAKPVKVKLIADRKTGRIIGGQVTGYEAVAERIDIITLAIQQNLHAEQLAQLSYSAQPWQTFFPARNAIVQAASDVAEKLKKTE